MPPEDAFPPVEQLVGAPVNDPEPPWVRVATADAIRHFARAYGDDNPLYSDPAYAQTSIGGLIAPPLFPLATGSPPPSSPQGAATEIDIERLPGARTQRIVGETWRFERPVPEDTLLHRERWVVDATREPGVCMLTERTRYAVGSLVYAERDRTRRYSLDADPPPSRRTERARYSAMEVRRIQEGYETVTRRGARPRFAEQVAVGERVGPMLKGPLTVTDLIDYRAGVGPGPLGGEPLGLAYRNRIRRPDVYTVDPHGVPDITERRHWDDYYAHSVGMPSPNDYSHTRLTWFSHLLTDWMGDAGRLSEFSASTELAPNYVGDTHWLVGEVRSVSADGTVVIDLAGSNQLDEVTCRGTAVVLLPTRASEETRRPKSGIHVQ